MRTASARPAPKPQSNPSVDVSFPFESRRKFERYSNTPNLERKMRSMAVRVPAHISTIAISTPFSCQKSAFPLG